MSLLQAVSCTRSVMLLRHNKRAVVRRNSSCSVIGSLRASVHHLKGSGRLCLETAVVGKAMLD